MIIKSGLRFGFLLLVLNTLLACSHGSTDDESAVVQQLEGCPIIESGEKSLSFFSELDSWNHVKRNKIYAQLSRPSSNYQKGLFSEDEVCPALGTYGLVLLKKMGDWDQNHSSGIHANLEVLGLRFEDVESVELTLKIGKEFSYIPSFDELEARFGFAADTKTLSKLDNAGINFNLSLLGGAIEEGSGLTFNADYELDLDSAAHLSRWIHISVPVSSMFHYLEENYDEETANLQDYSHIAVTGFRLNPETASRKVVRHFNRALWDEGEVEAELFKEFDVRLADVRLVLKN